MKKYVYEMVIWSVVVGLAFLSLSSCVNRAIKIVDITKPCPPVPELKVSNV